MRCSAAPPLQPTTTVWRAGGERIGSCVLARICTHLDAPPRVALGEARVFCYLQFVPSPSADLHCAVFMAVTGGAVALHVGVRRGWYRVCVDVGAERVGLGGRVRSAGWTPERDLFRPGICVEGGAGSTGASGSVVVAGV